MADKTLTFKPSGDIVHFMNSQINSGLYRNYNDLLNFALFALREHSANSKILHLKSILDEADKSPTINNWDLGKFLNEADARIESNNAGN